MSARALMGVVVAALVGCAPADDAGQPDGCGDGVLDPGEACDGAVNGGSCEACELVCWPSWDDCNQDERDGCEAELATESSCGACGVECADGETCVMGGCAEVVALGQGFVHAVATPGGLVWATYRLSSSGEGTSTVSALDVASGEITVLAADIELVQAIVADADHVYLLQAIPSQGNTTTRIARIAHGGDALETVADDPTPSPAWLVLDDTHVYWSNGAYDVLRVAKDGGGVLGVAVGQGLGFPRALAGADATHVYWGEGGSIMRIEKDGANLEPLHMNIAELGGDTNRITMDPATGIIYALGSEEFEERAGWLVAAPTDGAAASVVTEGLPNLCEDAGADCYTNYGVPVVGDGTVYWSAASLDRDPLGCEVLVGATDVTIDPPETTVAAVFRGCANLGAGGGPVAEVEDELYIQLPAHEGALVRRQR